MNEVFETEPFTKIRTKLSLSENEWIENVKDQIKENLFVGRHLVFYWLREKKNKGLRIYFVINENSKKAIIVAISNKKDQQGIINHILRNKMDYFKEIT